MNRIRLYLVFLGLIAIFTSAILNGEIPNNPILNYDPEYAIKLLNEAGWKRPITFDSTWKTTEGIFTNKRKQFIITEFPIYKNSARIYDPLIDDLKKVGIKLEYNVVQDPFSMAMNRNFQLFNSGWVGTHIPSPEHYMHSKYADKVEVTNITSMNIPEIDKLID